MTAPDFFLVDAFTDHIFGGNPAAVCPLQRWPDDDRLLRMTQEHNQAETAFFVATEDGFELRWFTVLGEINLCGHATLATAQVIFNHLHYPGDEIRFSTRFVGPLTVKRKDDGLMLDFPAWYPEPVETLPSALLEGLGITRAGQAFSGRDYLLVLENEQAVRNVNPDFSLLGQAGKCVCITAAGDDCDFVSRFFCPGDAHQEDPVTGSTHTMLIPFWSKRLGKQQMMARQLSARGGELRCEYTGDRVLISGQARTYLQGSLFLTN
ncbi:PhzF family phenazine biosynthesis protein [Edaphovirga cremea]|uniref:PhzF family phenazine biosynthesis protein n=1 Tax=Edaphovirga cremea TaxID=2267246 RepID=UPI000DEFBAFB|nr:PhzF family phenazine biosynthesis protein [Edaphovirga cremea]